MSRRVTLTRPQLDEMARGRFVKVDVGRPIEIAGVRTRSALVGRVGGGLRAYANICRHQAVPLDFGMDTAMADDGHHLLCHQHGAMYRPEDGMCILGPCKGDKLWPLGVHEDGDDALTLDVPEALRHG
jgi:nitrite reductase/ring-hydroxylating ferredoxin subunit